MTTNDEDRRQFTCICRNVFKVRQTTGGFGTKTTPLALIGMERFGLTDNQARLCMARARADLDEIQRLDRLRKAGMHNVPTDSDSLVALIKKKNERLAA